MSRGWSNGTAPEGTAALGPVEDGEGGGALAGLADHLLDAITTRDVRNVLQKCPPKVLRALLRQVGLPDARKITLRTAETVLRTLRGGDPRRRGVLRDIIGDPIVHAFGNPDHLDAGDCAGLLTTATAGDVLARATWLHAVLCHEDSPAILRWSLARAVELNRPLAPVALGLLVPEPAGLGPYAGAVESAWSALRARHPELPETPIDVLELRELAVSRLEAPATMTTDDPARDGAEADQADTPAPADLAAALDDLRARLPAAAEAAARIAGELGAGHRPEDADLEQVLDAADAFDRTRAQAEEASPGAGGAGGLAELTAVLDTLREAERQDTRTVALTRLEGPENLPPVLREAIDEVRRAARSGGGDGLAALAELIEVIAEPDGYLRMAELAERAREQLPTGLRVLVDVALAGHLRLGAATPAEPAAADPGEDPEPPPPPPPPAPAPPPEDGGADLADLDALLAETLPAAPAGEPPSEPRAAKPEEKAPTITPASVTPPAPVTTPAPETTPVPETAPAPATVPAAVPEAAASEQDREAGVVPPADLDPEVIEAEVAALRGGRFALAGRLRTAAGRPPAEERARRCAALAGEMVTFAGPLSAEFAEAARDLDAKALAGDPGGRVLAWAAAIRAGLVHPTPESTRLLEELTRIVAPHPDLADCGEAFARAARSGAYLGPGLAGRIRGTAEAAMIRRNAATEASRLLEEEPYRKIRYHLATEVWKELVHKDGPIGGLLAIAERDDADGVDTVVAATLRLRSGDAINRLIDERSALIAGHRKNKKIIAKAHTQLVKRVENALDTAGRWAVAAKEAAPVPAADAQDWHLGPLGRLQDAVGERRAAIDAALGDMGAGADPALAAATGAARRLLGRALDLLAGKTLDTPEAPVAHVLNRHLLLAPGIALGASTLEPLAALTTDQLVPVALDGSDEWTAAFEGRAARLDHEGTRAVIAVLERADPEAAASLRDRREELVRAARAARDRRIEEIRDRVAEWVRDGVLTEDQVRAAEERLRPLSGDRLDFDRVARALDELLGSLMADRQAAIGRERDRLVGRTAEAPRIEAVADRITRCIDAGDLTTAREFLAQIEAGNALPESTVDTDHFDRFHPAFPAAFADFAVRAGSRARKQDTPEVLTELMTALRSGQDVTDPDLSGLLAGARIKIPVLRNARREEAREGLRQWKACGLGSKTAGNMRSGTTAILRMIGLEGEQRDGPREQHRVWIDLEAVRRVGDTPLPAFGSRMSPSGDRLRLVLVWRRPGPQQLIELLKGQPEDQAILVFYFGALTADERRQLAAAARRRPAPVAAVLDDAAIGYLACMPEADWSTVVALTAPFTATNPYAPVGDVPAEMFYGRDDQLREVTGRSGSSFVYGGRQLGKSALLRKAQRDIQRTDPGRTVILENIQTVGKVAPPGSLWPKLADKLARAGVIPGGTVQRDQVREAVRAWARDDPRRQVLILLDEADHFLNQDAKDGLFENVTALRDLMTETDRRVKVVFAGLHQTARFQSLPNQPLAHLGTPVAVGPLEPQNAFDLLVRPLATLGFRLPETLAARVIAEANNAPALVQLFAEELLARLRRNPGTIRTLPYEITREDVEAVWRDKTLVRGFRDRFEWTLNLDKRYKVIAYTVALHALAAGADETLSVSELWEQCEDGWAAGFAGCASDDFRGLLDECVNLGVLGLDRDRDRYRLRTPHILNLLGGIDDVQKVLDNAGEFELPDAFDAHSYRRAYRDGPERSPLSSAQLARLARPHGYVHIVAGSRALHADRVHQALKDEETERPELKVHRVTPGGLGFDSALARAGRHGGHTVIVVDVAEGRTAQYFDERVAEARAAVARRERGTVAVVLIAAPHLAPAWVRAATLDAVELLQLRRFESPSIRQWMSEDSQGFPDEAGQDALLARTGGWPTLIGQVVQRLADHRGDRDLALDHCATHLRQNPAEFVRSTGVLADRALAAAWTLLARDNTVDTPGELAALLELHGEESLPELAPPELEALGYAGTADLIEALRVLGALVPADGRMACEPVLADATRHLEAG